MGLGIDSWSISDGGSGSGETNTGYSLGSGVPIYAQKVGAQLQFRSLSAGTNITFVSGDTITINASISGGTSGGGSNINGLNTYTAGTSTTQSINVSALTIDNLTVSGQSSFQTILSGGTNLQDIINSSVTGVTSGITGSINVNGLNTYTGGTIANQTINISAATLSSLNVSGTSILTTLSAGTLSAGTIYSGSTPLSTIIQNIASEYVSGGGTGHTGQFMDVFTANTTWIVPVGVFSVVVEMWGGGGGGGCGVYNPSVIGSAYGGGGGAGGAYITREVPVTPGQTISVTVGSGGTPGYGVSSFNINGTSATNGGDTIFGSAIASGGTKGDNATWTSVVNGAGGIAKYDVSNEDVTFRPAYIFSRGYDGEYGAGSYGGAGGDAPMFGRVKVNLQAAGARGVDPTDNGGNAKYFAGGGGGGYDLGSTGGTGTAGICILRWNAGSGITYQYNVAFSGGTITGDTIVTGNLSANTYFSGATSFETILGRYALSSHTHPISGITNLQGSLDSKSNLSGATFTGNIYAPIITGGTIYSGNTDVSTLFATPANITNLSNRLATKVDITGTTFDARFATKVDITGNTFDARFATKSNLSGATFTGGVIAPSLSATTISGGTLYSASTDISTLFATPSQITLINNQLATKLNDTGDTWTNTLNGQALSATTLSGGTLYSGSTNIGSMFRTTGSTLPFEIGYALSDETTAIASASTATLTSKIPFSGTISSVYFSVGTSGSTLSTFDIKNNGVTIFSTKPTIDANEFGTDTAATAAVITATTLNRYDVLTFFINGAGTGAKGLKAWVLGSKTS